MQKVGIVGWRGMVGSVLMQRMQEEDDFAKINTFLFSSSLHGQKAPVYGNCYGMVLDSNDLEKLKDMDIILTCQGSEFTSSYHQPLRAMGWTGIWVDAASGLRMSESSMITLDPINGEQIMAGLNSGVKDFIGGNCTVSLMLMALGSLFQEDLVEWATSMTYQAASGAGAKSMVELLDQMGHITETYNEYAHLGALDIEKKLSCSLNDLNFPKENFGNPLALSLLPWIDQGMDNGQSKEEWKAQVEANKILGTKDIIPIDGTCVRVSSLRCHSQALTLKLKKSVSIGAIEELIQNANQWTEFVPNERGISLSSLTPAAISGTMKIPVGRVRKMTLGDQYLNVFTLGDQLLWGAAEPLRRMLNLAIS